MRGSVRVSTAEPCVPARFTPSRWHGQSEPEEPDGGGLINYAKYRQTVGEGGRRRQRGWVVYATIAAARVSRSRVHAEDEVGLSGVKSDSRETRAPAETDRVINPSWLETPGHSGRFLSRRTHEWVCLFVNPLRKIYDPNDRG